MISHHIPSELIIAYAANALDAAQSLALDAHISLCNHCQKEVANAHMMGAACFEQLEPASMGEGAINSLLEKLDVMERMPSQNRDFSHSSSQNAPSSEIPSCITHLVDGDLDTLKWKKIAPGAYRYDLAPETSKSQNRNRNKSESKLFLLKVEPKAKVPEHSHHGHEITLILRGAYRDKFGHFKRGDIACHDQEVEHEPIISSDAPCISLVATDAPLKFKGVFIRLLQPFIGI